MHCTTWIYGCPKPHIIETSVADTLTFLCDITWMEHKKTGIKTTIKDYALKNLKTVVFLFTTDIFIGKKLKLFYVKKGKFLIYFATINDTWLEHKLSRGCNGTFVS